jgi:hypothetical protein
MLLVLNAYKIYILQRFCCIRYMRKYAIKDFEFCTIEDFFFLDEMFNFRAVIFYVLQG